MASWFVDSAQYTNVAQWAALTAYSAGAIVRQLATPNVGSERCFQTAAGGISGVSEPVWNLGHGASQPTDNTITDWKEITGSAWTAPFAREGSSIVFQVGAVSSIANGGTSGTYAVNDILTLSSAAATYGDQAVFKVTTVSTGKVTAVSIVNAGSYVTTPGASGVATTGGGGTGCTLTVTGTQAAAAGDTFWIGDDSASTQATALTLTFPGTAASPNYIYCGDHTKASPGTGDLKTTATISTTGASNLTINGSFYSNGINPSAGSSNSQASLILEGSAGFVQTWQNCQLALGNTNTASRFSVGNGGYLVWERVTLKFGSVSQTIADGGCVFTWQNTASAIQGSVPTTLFNSNNSAASPNTVIIEAVDLSAAGSGKTLIGSPSSIGPRKYYLKDCEPGASVTIAATPITVGFEVYNIRSDSSNTNYRLEKYSYVGTMTTITSIVRTGGASVAGTAVAKNITTTANSNWVLPFVTIPFLADNTVTGSNVTVTVYGIWNSASLPNNDQIWAEVEYLGTSGYPLGTYVNNTKANNLAAGTPLTADSTSIWNSKTTARANNTVYTLGQVIGVPVSGGGGLFFCTAGGTSAAAQPAGYATAVDGGAVTDGTATFRAGTRFSMAVTMSSPQPQITGFLTVRVKAAQANSTFYIDM